MTKALEIIGKHVEDLSVKLSDEEVMERGNRADFKAGLVRDIRVDTCATVRTRALSEAERQGALKLHAEGERINKGKLTPEERERMEAEAAALTPAFEEQEQQ
jgi:hypothetical protein